MKPIETYYLIDYENVNSDGLKGCDRLTKADHIIIFFTKNASKINMSDIADHGAADLQMIEIAPGKQSADIHISSYLGYLTGSGNDGDRRIVIISKDSDFDHVISFWNEKADIEAARAPCIEAAVPKQENVRQPAVSVKPSSK